MSVAVLAQSSAVQPDPSYNIVSGSNWAQTKNYYLLTLLQQDKAAIRLLSEDAELLKLAQQKLSAIGASPNNCKDVTCFATAAKFSDAEIQQVSAALRRLYKPGNALDKLVRQHLIPSGMYILYSNLPSAEMLVKVWEQDAGAVNHCISVYAEGKLPNYPKIDSIAFDVKSRSFGGMLLNLAMTINMEQKTNSFFFEPSMNYALHLLELNERMQAADFEPMVEGINRDVVQKLTSVNWSKYKYSVILVPGAGPELRDIAMSPEGMIRCRIAAVSYFKGMAPFVMVSGGKVHPYKTKYCEAEEMKKYMVEILHVPEEAIIAEPHARHTTTNMRNCVRILFRMGFPMNKPFIVSSDKFGSSYVSSIEARCQKELGMVPYKMGKRLSDTEQEFLPALEALQIDADEPMDP